MWLHSFLTARGEMVRHFPSGLSARVVTNLTAFGERAVKYGKKIAVSGVVARDFGIARQKNAGMEIPAGLIGKNHTDLTYVDKEAARKRSIGLMKKNCSEKKFQKMVVSNPEYPCGFIGMNPNNFRGDR